MYGLRQRPSHLICGLCPSITDTSFALRFPHMLILHVILDHAVSLEDVALSRRFDSAVRERGLAAAGQPGMGVAVEGDRLPGLRCSRFGLLSKLLSIANRPRAKRGSEASFTFNSLVELAGIEPATPWLQIKPCSSA